jgi:hypothetical protein
MKITILPKSWLLLAALPVAIMAQPEPTDNSNSAGDHWRQEDAAQWGPHEGTTEITLSGSGSSNKQMSNSLGGADVSLGYYFAKATELSLRQEVDYTHPQGVSAQWDGSTKLALDQDFLTSSRFRPFIGANIGGIYGQRVRDTWAAGLEGGLKFYALRKTFIVVEPEYDWFFRHAHGLIGKAKFNEGEWNWRLGVGFDL